ncbi:MAG: 16S rRNA (cytidine(1402)-2'-O)-methyltransferase [Candidatus Levybacteria bacterium RIFCSPHIGHO2_02_FULL_40_18]|nr:MAG: 16S rRNA (cytidine(1402)-2'-O)-methyltransferase [Candidatus Levybacteria bacterium RIFCSPHIGHO2_01_FULL_40_58]OGH27298.1 MAG: 16S rRNA (cytidine(1402)-2'-O)-methyltransferase [Candidatus Levybacteria bacterium RIFCSPHIGHO2_02_FULL_40_18]OGH30935.1 MAG: 16S rRNA (cytidine(1402)-2'-O)-methyltransferase [Candidatus Levybacteria bacterium RIFCSPHIGHO2_12_FULL_40_31]OGH40946.1 MAG: 16S rRNA (cytidine(1402)-2'-O)-methyltransferase [Candidatus Levybacteria bacterium RIFCSPLOWO2_01_FULL_40_64]
MNNLYIVATPIGNLQDITLRAANILLGSNVIIAESASKAGILLDFLEKEFKRKRINEQKIISMIEEEEENEIPSILKLVETNDVALISEAGTPLISDPGFKLVRECIRRGVRIIPIPGASAFIAALSVSGLPINKVTFNGFLPKSEAKMRAKLVKLKNSDSTIVLFESPHRLIKTLKNIQEVFGDIEIVVARELTKIHEEIRRGKISESIEHFEKVKPKGEFVILF